MTNQLLCQLSRLAELEARDAANDVSRYHLLKLADRLDAAARKKGWVAPRPPSPGQAPTAAKMAMINVHHVSAPAFDPDRCPKHGRRIE